MDDANSKQLGHAVSESPRVVNAIILKSEPRGIEGETVTWLSMTVKTVEPIVEFVEMSVRFFKIGGKPNAAELKTLISVMAPMAVGGFSADANLHDVQFVKFGSATVGQARSFQLVWPTFRVIAHPCRPRD
jgi:hypothetical protein